MPDLIPRTPEQPRAVPESAPEHEAAASKEGVGEPKPSQPPELGLPGAAWPEPTPPAAAPSALARKIEAVLEEDLAELYQAMTPEQQLEFKRRGEVTANKIAVMLKQVKVKVQELLKLVRDWLRTIPGINKYFAEQEAKIKADKLLRLRSGA